MKKNLIIVIISLFSFFISFSQNSYENDVSKLVRDTNRGLPAMVDNSTRLDFVSVLPGKIYRYNYTLVNVEKRSLNVANYTRDQKIDLINGVRRMSATSGFDFFRRNNVIFSYYYKDKNGEFISNILVTPNDYR